MRRIWWIFWREYWGHLTRRSYLLLTVGFPLFMMGAPIVGGIVLVIALHAGMPSLDPRPIGLLDQADLLAGSPAPTTPVEVKRFDNLAQAAAALAAGEIQAYYHIQPDYWETGEVIASYPVAPHPAIEDMLAGWITGQVRHQVPPEILTRLDNEPHISHRDLAGVQSYSLADMSDVIIVYLLIYFMRLGGSFTAEYMFGSIVSEANDRTLEIVLSSVSPLQFLLGKLLGLLAVGLTQLGLWGGVVLALSLGTSALLGFDLTGFLLTWEHLGLMLSVLLGAYLLDQMLAAALGLLKVSGGAGSLFYSGFGYLAGLSLIYAAYFVPRNPDSLLAVAASLFPLTAPLVLLVRVVVSEVPAWQVALSQILLWGSSLALLFWLRRLLRANFFASTPFELRRWVRQLMTQRG